MSGNEENQEYEEERSIEEEATQNEIERQISTPKVIHPLPKISPPFPQLLMKNIDDDKFKKLLLVFKSLLINWPLIEALLEMLRFSMFMKELVTEKRILDFKTIEVSHNCSAIMTNEIIKKRDGLEVFTIPCTINISLIL